MRSPFQWAAGTLSLVATASVCAMLAFGQAGPPAGASAGPRQAASPGGSGARPGRTPVTVGSQGALPTHASFTQADVEKGQGLFLQNCAFCHGKDANGGESGPALTRSKYVADDKNGENIGYILHNGRVEKGMPRFDNLGEADVRALVAFVHAQQDAYLSQTGTRKGVEESDLHTGNAAAGKAYFEGAGGCVSCHSPEGNLKGVATRYTGLQLEERMLYPRDAKATVEVTLPNGSRMNGEVGYLDEFTLSFVDSNGGYHTFPTGTVQYKVNNPVDAHVALLSKYTDDDIHNVLAYVQTMK